MSLVFTFSQVRKQQMADMRRSRNVKIVNSLAIVLPCHGPLHAHPYEMEICTSEFNRGSHLFVCFSIHRWQSFPDKPYISL